jgi:hypothetical protein
LDSPKPQPSSSRNHTPLCSCPLCHWKSDGSSLIPLV